MEQQKVTSRIETLDNNRTVIHVGESTSSNKKNVSDIINRFNKNIWDGQYSFTNDNPPLLIYYLRLPFETLMDSIRIQSDEEINVLKIFIEQQERNEKKRLLKIKCKKKNLFEN